MQKLMSVFKAESPGQLIVIFVVFAVTGSAAVYAAGPVLDFFGINSEKLLPLDFLATPNSRDLPYLSMFTHHHWHHGRTI